MLTLWGARACSPASYCTCTCHKANHKATGPSLSVPGGLRFSRWHQASSVHRSTPGDSNRSPSLTSHLPELCPVCPVCPNICLCYTKHGIAPPASYASGTRGLEIASGSQRSRHLHRRGETASTQRTQGYISDGAPEDDHRGFSRLPRRRCWKTGRDSDTGATLGEAHAPHCTLLFTCRTLAW